MHDTKSLTQFEFLDENECKRRIEMLTKKKGKPYRQLAKRIKWFEDERKKNEKKSEQVQDIKGE